MYRIRDHKPDAKEVWSGNNRIEFKGSTSFEESSINKKKSKEPEQAKQDTLL